MHKLQKSGSRKRSMNILGNTVDKIGQFDQNPLFATHLFEKQLQCAFQCRDEKSLCKLSPEPDEIHENRRFAQNDGLIITGIFLESVKRQGKIYLLF